MRVVFLSCHKWGRHWDITYTRNIKINWPEADRLANNFFLIWFSSVVDDRRRSSGRREDPRRHTLGTDMMHYANQAGNMQRSMDLEVSFVLQFPNLYSNSLHYSFDSHSKSFYLLAFCASHSSEIAKINRSKRKGLF